MIALGGAIAAVAAAVAAHGAFHRNSPVFGRVIARLPGPERRLALTFDDGPNPEATPRILDVLGELAVPATFFVLGKHADRWPALVRRTADDGHMLANHGWHHQKLHRASDSFVRDDLARGARSIEQASGVRPTLFRAPHGFRSPRTTAIAASLGQRTVGWTLGVWDSARPGADEITRRAAEGCRPGTILLLHDGDGYDPAGDRRQTAEALPRIVERLRAAGFSFVALPADA
jgi:peptidoglycan/xylan/chitin deacetylase (PgdA/CDA1 family)